MQQTLRISLLCLALLVATLLPQTVSSADFSAIWDGGNGNWDDPLHWNTNPSYPNNTGGVTYDATINSGTVTLDRDITLQRLFLSGNANQHIGTLTGAFQLTLNEGLTWTGGTIGATTTINLVSGSVSNITGGDAFTHWLLGTINNEGIVNEDMYIRYFAGVINNRAGAVWNFKGFGINGGGGMFGVPHDGIFNNAGSLIFTRSDATLGNPVQFNTTLNNSGIVTVQSGGSGFASVYVDKGSATGAFNVGSQAQLQFGNYSLTTGARISGAGVTNIQGTLDIIGNASINSNLVNSGTLLVESGTTLTLDGSFTHTPIASSAPLAITRLNGGTIASNQTIGFANGILAGHGTIDANVNLSGSLLNFQLGGTTAGGGANNYDVISVNGGTTLAGSLGIFFKNGFETSITASNVFTVLTSNSGFTGSFDNAASGARMDTADYLGTFLVNYKAHGITLSNFVPSTRWLGGKGNWTDASHWLSNPMFPNDNGNTHYSVLIRDGSVNLNTNISISRFFMTGGTLTGGNSLTVSSGLVWTNGNISGGGSLNLLAGSVSNISTPLDGTVGARKQLIGTLNNFGTLNQTTDIGAEMGQTFVNNMAGATWNIDTTRVGGFVTETGINNFGSVTIKGLFDTFGLFNSTGTVILQRGTTLSSFQILNFGAGQLMGSGTINGNVSIGSNAPGMVIRSVVTPGDQFDAIGTFTINGQFQLSNSAKIVMDISGGATPTNDLLVISGTAFLDGILELHVSLTQFNPKQTFTLLTFSNLSGVFDNVVNGGRLTSADGTTSFQVNYGAGSPYGANNLVLSDPQAVPEPMSLALFVGGAAAIALFRVRKR